MSDERVTLAHGAGGRAMRALIEAVFLDGVDDPEARALGDGAVVPLGDRFLVLTTDAHVVSPAFFPGGDIGRLAVCGTVNDLAVMGACDGPLLTSGVIVEEGFAVADLRRLHASMREAAREAGARVIAGDTKVMRRGEIDGIALCTSGVALADRPIRDRGLRPGDALVLTGTVGDHGLAVLAARHDLGLSGDLRSDVAPLNGLLRAALRAGGKGVHAMKDPTRGGVTSALHEMASKSRVRVVLREAAIPLSAAGRAASELLGVDPLSVANEGKALLGVHPDALADVLAALRAHPLGRQAAHVGWAREAEGEAFDVLLETGFGTRRLVERDHEALPRIC